MPELMFRIRWPDASETANYSPSSIIKNHFDAGKSYEIPDFLTRARSAMAAASARVAATYGHPCSRAAATLAAIESRAATYSESETITVIEITP
jgi:uncharacterized repeat protein (TIGR04042 family)